MHRTKLNTFLSGQCREPLSWLAYSYEDEEAEEEEEEDCSAVCSRKLGSMLREARSLTKCF